MLAVSAPTPVTSIAPAEPRLISFVRDGTAHHEEVGRGDDLVTLRLRAAFQWSGEQDIRVWNKFAQRGLENKDGFRKCLKLTLYRPRDVIALLNGAFQEANRSGRDRIIDTDIESTAVRISKTRLSDLYKEYVQVLPGLPLFAEAFRARPPRGTYGEVIERLDEIATQPHDGVKARDFALLSTGAQAFNALYSVGLIRIQTRRLRPFASAMTARIRRHRR